MLPLANADARGRSERTRAAIHRGFVLDLHRRLASQVLSQPTP
jgi:hypothetical protein